MPPKRNHIMKVLDLKESKIKTFEHLNAFGFSEIVTVNTEQELPLAVAKYIDWLENNMNKTTCDYITKNHEIPSRFAITNNDNDTLYCAGHYTWNGVKILVEYYVSTGYEMTSYSFNETVYNTVINIQE